MNTSPPLNKKSKDGKALISKMEDRLDWFFAELKNYKDVSDSHLDQPKHTEQSGYYIFQ